MSGPPSIRVSEVRAYVECVEHGKCVATLVEDTPEGIEVTCSKCLLVELRQQIETIQDCIDNDMLGCPDLMTYDEDMITDEELIYESDHQGGDWGLPPLPHFRPPEDAES